MMYCTYNYVLYVSVSVLQRRGERRATINEVCGGAAGLESMSSFAHVNRMAMYILVKAGGTKGELYRSVYGM